ncbi:sacsin N-terminal ATP-binding-like domain-containing protein [Parasphingorhabdus pacifica]
MSGADPFGTAALRQAVLQAWEASPTRFREDANAEEDLRLGGYRDRLLVELAQNAADAAGSGGVLSVRIVDGELRVANTGAELTADGVAGLASLRASAKRGSGSVGRFGVGFAAVLGISDEPRVVSRSGAVAFSASGTRAEVARLPTAADELSERAGSVPVLRLVWPVGEEPPAGFDTEVRLPLRPDVDADALLESFTEQAADLLLALPALAEVRIGDSSWRREDDDADRLTVRGPGGSTRWLVHRGSGVFDESALAELGAEARHSTGWWVCWAVPLDPDGVPIPLAEDVLHAPTPTEERLSLPARLLASVPLEADRRRVAVARASDEVLASAAACFPALIEKLTAEHRPSLVPLPGFPLSDVDDKLRLGVLERLRDTAWLPGAGDEPVAPREAKVVDHAAPELVELLREVVPGLASAELSEARHRRALSALEVPRMGAAEVVAAVTGLDRPVAWWRDLYAALAPIEAVDPYAREEFTALPVPLVDGRTVTGMRDVLLIDEESDPAELLSTLDVSGLRIADPGVSHPLLEKLGAHRAGPDDLLDSPALAEAVRGSVADARSGVDVRPLADAVLRLVDLSRSRDWLGALALPESGGDFRRADELLLPDAVLLEVLATEEVGEDGPLGALDARFAERWSRHLLRSVGVLDGFVVVTEEEPTEPDHRCPDTRLWWAEREAADPEQWPPARFTGVRDLDLVADEAWPAAIRLLAQDPDGSRALREPGGYPAWWLARFAMLAGAPPRAWRLPEADGIAGLYDPVPDVGLPDELLRLAGVRDELRVDTEDDAADVLGRLADRARTVRAGTALRAHGALAESVAAGIVDPGAVETPVSVRSVSGAVVDAERAAVLDEPWMLGVLDAPLVVSGGGPEEFDAEALAELLDLPLASEENSMRVQDEGKVQAWREVGRVATSCELLGVPIPDGQVTLYDGLRVQGAGEPYRVHWWVDAFGAVHAERTPDGLGRALAWSADRWKERFALAALLADPEATTLLR